MKLNKKIAQKVKEVVEYGLTCGIGEPIPGQMCVEAAVCYAYGLPHSDNPPCVGSAVRQFKIRLNDSRWSSNQARGQGMLKLSIAQLNSNVIDQNEFSRKIVLQIVNQIIAPIAAKYFSSIEEKLRIVTDLSEAAALCRELLRNIQAAVDYATDYATAAAVVDAAEAADYAAEAADIAAATAAGYAVDAAADAVVDAAVRDKFLVRVADICLDVLKEMKSPGCEYLYLVEN